MTRLFWMLLSMSFAAGALSLLVIGLTPLTRRRFSAGWHRLIHCVALAFYALPLGPLAAALWRALAPRSAAEPGFFAELPVALRNVNLTHSPAEISSALPGDWQAALVRALPAVWLAVAVLLLLWRCRQLRRFQRQIERTSTPVTEQELCDELRRAVRESGCRHPIRLLESACIQSPIITVLRRSAEGRIALVLPAGQWANEELRLILRHELTHCRQRDLWVKWAGLLLRTVHWYNPAIYLLVKRLDRWIERACDEILAREMDTAQRRAYGCAILDVLARAGKCGGGIHAALGEDKQDMKERLSAIMHAKPSSKRAKRTSAALLALVCAVGVLISMVGCDAPAASTAKPATGEAAGSGTQVGDFPGNALSVTDAADDAVETIPAASEDYGQGPEQFLWPIDEKVSATTFQGHVGNGVDFAPGGGGDPVYASAAGVVVRAVAGYTGYGHYIVLDHGGGYQTRYAHLGSIEIAQGDEVAAGQTIGTIGRTGRATGNHLHFEVRRDGECLHPLDYVNADNTPMDFPE